jgi:hypothetical protein
MEQDLFSIETLQESNTEVLDEAVALSGGSSNSSNNTATEQTLSPTGG